MSDLTIVMLTFNLVPEGWAEYHKHILLEAAGDNEIITISNKPLNWGTNLIQTEYGLDNIYRQMLRAAEIATTTYIATADDDTLYPKEHFNHRPPLDVFSYNLTRWHLFTWGTPFYFHKPLPGNGLLIAPRELAIAALKNRDKAGFPHHMRHELGTRRDTIEADGAKWGHFYTAEPIASFYHELGADPACRNHRKKAWPIRALEIPIWGRAEDLRKLWK